MTAETMPLDLRRVLDAPRGRRFNRTALHPGIRPQVNHADRTAPEALPPLVSLGRTPRQRELLARMPDTPGLRRRFAHGDLPEWMRRAESSESCRRQDAAPDRTPEPKPAPAPEPDREPDQDPEPERPVSIPRPRREQAPPPPLPRRSDRPRRPASHRKPRRRTGLLVTGYALAVTAGAMGQYLVAFLS
ncbi:hypothetical protein GCM10007079_52770 [Nocardiopsis terrae]|uniref:Uncharacterized protein n=1 Tax=Nocardiopsis terrae TaxID=372655 RepID=A0ABR9HA29_9ACTN|nr:hypothetical protein [Nocardiopsis terrae]MBE1455900.1 hypothetical protein [Nocardiopsis terrae]GHC98426.1 hypothetical protein GCM10007079_52770 [Nocardiopsis terrae]